MGRWGLSILDFMKKIVTSEIFANDGELYVSLPILLNLLSINMNKMRKEQKEKQKSGAWLSIKWICYQ